MIVYGGKCRGSQVQEEAVYNKLVLDPAALREIRIRVVTAIAAAGHVTQAQGILASLHEGAKVDHLSQRAARVLPESHRPKREDYEGIDENCRCRQHHGEVR